MSKTTGQVNYEFKNEMEKVFNGYKAMLAEKNNKAV